MTTATPDSPITRSEEVLDGYALRTGQWPAWEVSRPSGKAVGELVSILRDWKDADDPRAVFSGLLPTFEALADHGERR